MKKILEVRTKMVQVRLQDPSIGKMWKGANLYGFLKRLSQTSSKYNVAVSVLPAIDLKIQFKKASNKIQISNDYRWKY